ncbi:hypothetical protein T439DRAFT_384731 [Meredithblackwellia eburnea MCA 4105]
MHDEARITTFLALLQIKESPITGRTLASPPPIPLATVAPAQTSSATVATADKKPRDLPPEIIRLILSHLYSSLALPKPIWDPQPAYDRASTLTACARVNFRWRTIVRELQRGHLIVPEWRFSNATKFGWMFERRDGKAIGESVTKLEIAFSSVTRLVSLRIGKHREELEKEILAEREDESPASGVANNLKDDPEELAFLVSMRAMKDIYRDEGGTWLHKDGEGQQLLAFYNILIKLPNLTEISLYHVPYDHANRHDPPFWIAPPLAKVKTATFTCEDTEHLPLPAQELHHSQGYRAWLTMFKNVEHLTLSPHDFTHLPENTPGGLLPHLQSLVLHALHPAEEEEWAFRLSPFLRWVSFASLTIQWRELAMLNRLLRPINDQSPYPNLPPVNSSIEQVTIIQEKPNSHEQIPTSAAFYVSAAFMASTVKRLTFEMMSSEAAAELGESLADILAEPDHYPNLDVLNFKTARGSLGRENVGKLQKVLRSRGVELILSELP